MKVLDQVQQDKTAKLHGSYFRSEGGIMSRIEIGRSDGSINEISHLDSEICVRERCVLAVGICR